MATASDFISGAVQGGAAGAATGNPWVAGGGAVLGGIGGILAGKSARDDAAEEAARIAAENAAREQAALEALEGYDPNKYYRQENYVGDVYAPDIVSSRSLQSEMGGIRLDPNLAAAQSASLSGLSDIIGQGGMTLQDRANFQDANAAAQLQASRQQAALRDELAARGMSGGGNETVARMMAAQGAADMSSKAARNMNASAQSRALEALMQRGALAGQMSGQDFSQKSAQAQAADNIARFNEQNRLGQANLGSQYKFDADMRNMNTKQGVETRNVQGLENLGTSVFNKANSKAGIYQNRSVNPAAKVPNAMDSFNTVMTAAGAGAKAYGVYNTPKNRTPAEQKLYDDSQDATNNIPGGRFA